jgi:uncharacterized membrane-anchored protein
MSLFLQRLRELLVITLIVCVIVIGIAWLCVNVNWIGYIFIVIWAIGVGGFTLYGVWTFVYWLFIEPFRVGTRKRKDGGRS